MKLVRKIIPESELLDVVSVSGGLLDVLKVTRLITRKAVDITKELKLLTNL